MPASNPGANLVKVACAPVLASPQIADMDEPGRPASTYFAWTADANSTFSPAACPCTRPIDHATTNAKATAATIADRFIESSLLDCSSPSTAGRARILHRAGKR